MGSHIFLCIYPLHSPIGIAHCTVSTYIHPPCIRAGNPIYSIDKRVSFVYVSVLKPRALRLSLGIIPDTKGIVFSTLWYYPPFACPFGVMFARFLNLRTSAFACLFKVTSVCSLASLISGHAPLLSPSGSCLHASLICVRVPLRAFSKSHVFVC